MPFVPLKNDTFMNAFYETARKNLEHEREPFNQIRFLNRINTNLTEQKSPLKQVSTNKTTLQLKYYRNWWWKGYEMSQIELCQNKVNTTDTVKTWNQIFQRTIFNLTLKWMFWWTNNGEVVKLDPQCYSIRDIIKAPHICSRNGHKKI